MPHLPSRYPLSCRAHLVCVVAALCFAVGGCDVFGSGGPSYAGVVVDAETGESIEGILVALQVGGGFGARSTVADAFTDAEGRFELRDPEDRASRASLYVNSPGYGRDGYNPLYFGGLITDYDFEDRHDLRIELTRR